MSDGEFKIDDSYNIEWLEKLSELGKDAKELNCYKDALTEYLKRLNSWMSSKNTKDILKQLPTVGKLLSTLSKICILSSDGALAKIVLEGILKLSKVPNSLAVNSSSNTERKASEWAINQLQFLTCPNITEEDANFYDEFGFTAKEVCGAQLEEVAFQIAKITENGNTDFLEMQKKSRMICAISQVVLPHVNQPEYKEIIESLLLSTEKPIGHFNFKTEKMENCLCEEFLVAVMQNQDLVENLNYKSTVCLWMCYLPAFETEVLDLLEAVVKRKFIDECSLFQLVSSHEKLINACSENVILCDYAFEILRESLSRLGGMCCLMSLVNVLYVCIRKKDKQEARISPTTSIIKSVRSLPAEISELTTKNKEKAIYFLAEELKILLSTNSEPEEIWFELLKNFQWVIASNWLIFHGSSLCIDSCLTVMSVFYLSKIDSDILRQEEQNVKPLIRDVMLVFLAVADGSHFVLRETFDMVTEEVSFDCKLDMWLRTLERLFSICEEITMSPEKKETFRSFLICLSDRAFEKGKKSGKDDCGNDLATSSTNMNDNQNDLQNRTTECASRIRII